MVDSGIQISAVISRETKERLESYSRAHGLKKGYIVESALLHHISALESLPSDVLVPARITVSRRTGEEILDRVRRPGEPAPETRELLGEADDG
ncbi:MAG: hypothetical protein R6V85_09790 [Polyangia bacterium]